MVTLLVSLLVALNGATPGGAIQTAGPECPAQTPHGRRLAVAYASSEMYAHARQRAGIPGAAAGEVRPVTDKEACHRLVAFVQERVKAAGGTFAHSRPEFYRVGEHYYAVSPAEPRRCTPRPRHVCITPSRWQALTVLDRDFKLVDAVAM